MVMKYLLILNASLSRPEGKRMQWFMNNFVENIKSDIAFNHPKRFKDLELLTNAMYMVNFHTNMKTSEFFYQILNTIQNLDESDIRTGRCLIQLILSIARMQVIDHDMIDLLMRKVNEFQPFREAESLNDLSYAGLNFLFTLR